MGGTRTQQWAEHAGHDQRAGGAILEFLLDESIEAPVIDDDGQVWKYWMPKDAWRTPW